MGKKILVFSFFICSFVFSSNLLGNSVFKETIFRLSPRCQGQKRIVDKEVLDKYDTVEKYAEYFRESFGLDRLYRYKAIALDSYSVCKQHYDSESCRELIDDSRMLRRLATGECGEADEFLEDIEREFCEAFQKEDCSSLDSVNYLICKGFLNLDLSFVKQGLQKQLNKGIINEIEYRKDIKSFKKEIAYYSIFKTNEIENCLRLTDNEAYFRKVGCYILGSAYPQKVIDDYALDFAYYYRAGKRSDVNFCAEIKDQYIKEHCQKETNLVVFISWYFLQAGS